MYFFFTAMHFPLYTDFAHQLYMLVLPKMNEDGLRHKSFFNKALKVWNTLSAWLRNMPTLHWLTWDL